MTHAVVTLSALFAFTGNLASTRIGDVLVARFTGGPNPLRDRLPAAKARLKEKPESQPMACLFLMSCESGNSRSVVEELLEAAQFVKVPGIRRGIQRLLARPAADGALELIAAQLDSAEVEIRDAAVASLVTRGDEAAIRALLKALTAA
nr:hypothetical protein [PVC group bacterium]